MKSISLELPLFTRFCSSSSGSRSKWVFYGGFSGCPMFCRRWNCYPKPPRLFSSWEKDCSRNLNRCSAMGTLEEDCGSVWGDSEFVEVIGIGSRKDAVIDFCLNSPMQSSSVRFWNIFRRDSLKVHLQQRSIGRDITPVLVETFLSAQQHLKTIVLVASAGYGSDHITAIDILRTTRSANGLAIGVILKPFSFEGKRRQKEVNNLVERLQEHTNFCIGLGKWGSTISK